MGGFCSCHRGSRVRWHHAEEHEEERRFDDGNIVLIGEAAGARVQLEGSSENVSMFSQQGKKGVNQDSMTAWEGFSGDKDMYFCAVFDGHGPSGHTVSQYVRDFLPTKLSQLYRQASRSPAIHTQNVSDEASSSSDSRNPFCTSWKDRITKSFHDMDEQLEIDPSIESYCSGSTSVSVLKKGENLIISNLGDSRAVLCTRDDNHQIISEQLTLDLKPDVPSEAERIIKCEGRVEAMKQEPDVYRLWMPNGDCPGLAMARAFGDFCLKDFGLISTPVVTYRKLTRQDEFVVLATDGVWDALSNDEVVKIVASADRSTAARSVVGNAVNAWRSKFPRSKIDDCSAVCLFFKPPSPILSSTVVSNFSLNHSDLHSNSSNGSVDSVDPLDTVLDCKTNEGRDSSKAVRRKRRVGKKKRKGGE